MNKTSYYAGIDVSKLYLDVHVLPEDLMRRFPNDAEGFDQLILFLRQWRVKLIVLEASGGYEHAAVVAMVNAGLPVHVAQPQTVRSFARSLKLKAKNDRIDASVCARYARDRAEELRLIEKIDKTRESIQALVARREQLVEMRAIERTRKKQASDKAVQRSLKRSEAALTQEIQKLEKAIDKMIKAAPELDARARKLRQTKGVGPQTVRVVMACLPELGQATPKQLNALVGVAPYDQESGNKKGRRRIYGGRKVVRNQLYMACMSAMTTNPVIAPYYKQMRDRHLDHKTAIMACIRKLLARFDKEIRSLQEPPTSKAA